MKYSILAPLILLLFASSANAESYKFSFGGAFSTSTPVGPGSIAGIGELYGSRGTWQLSGEYDIEKQTHETYKIDGIDGEFKVSTYLSFLSPGIFSISGHSFPVDFQIFQNVLNDYSASGLLGHKYTQFNFGPIDPLFQQLVDQVLMWGQSEYSQTNSFKAEIFTVAASDFFIAGTNSIPLSTGQSHAVDIPGNFETVLSFPVTIRARVDGYALGLPGYDIFQFYQNIELSQDYLRISAVPEPSTWASMILGFIICGLFVRSSSMRVASR